MEIDLRDDNNRYLFGNVENNRGRTLLFIGINPSFGTHLKKDNTMKRFENISLYYGYNSWLMLNIYPQIEPKPKYLDVKFNENVHKVNIQILCDYFKDENNIQNCDILCGWGTSIKKRKYLKKCLLDIYSGIFAGHNLNYYHIEDLSMEGHPKHISPRSIHNYKSGFNIFNIDNYLTT